MAKKNKPLPELSWLLPRVKVTRVLSLFSFFALLAVLLLWNLLHFDFQDYKQVSIIVLFEFAALLVVAPGVVLGSPYAHVWTAFIANLYFLKGVLAFIDPSRTWLGIMEIFLSVSLFLSAMMYSRWRSQLNRVRYAQTDAERPPLSAQ
ncbi:MAG: DUF2069 domain-containing protein [Gammaproteobacteria bacterium]|nr:DUF2069 domain-containing protein [Thiopseudomonas sp.]MCK9465043.1 DUF2069 domain-containing protein [Thiopseudomonas sp.]NLC09376.1 DUF2069 domain-containing protein [Gammaproteobacteria bacterium]